MLNILVSFSLCFGECYLGMVVGDFFDSSLFVNWKWMWVLEGW